MPAILNQLQSADELDTLFKRSYDRPVLLLKHSSSCGTSLDIFYQLKEINAEINYVVVQQHRALSNAVEDRVGHRHHSPQAFILKDGEVVYHATHYGIDPVAIEQHLL